MIWTKRALPYSKVRNVRLLKPLFFCSLLAQLPLKCLVSHPQYPMCFEFLIKSYKFVTQWPQCFFDFSSLFKKYETFHKINFHPNLWQNTFCLEFLERPPFLCKIWLLTRRPFFLWILPHRMSLTSKIGAVHSRLFYKVVPRGFE